MHTRIHAHPGLMATLLALASSATLAFQPLLTDDTGTQGDGGNQIELAYNRDRLKMDGSLTRTTTVPLVFTRGVSETLDFFVGTSHVRMRNSDPDTSVSGMGNPVLGLKWRFHENEASGTSLGLKPEVALPISAKREADGLGTGKSSPTLTLIATQIVPFGAIHANAALGRNRYRENSGNPQATIRRFSIAPVWDVAEQWKLAFDIGTQRERADGQSTRSHFVEFGAIYSPSSDLDFALGFIRQSANADPKAITRSLQAGVTWRFK